MNNGRHQLVHVGTRLDWFFPPPFQPERENKSFDQVLQNGAQAARGDRARKLGGTLEGGF